MQSASRAMHSPPEVADPASPGPVAEPTSVPVSDVEFVLPDESLPEPESLLDCESFEFELLELELDVPPSSDPEAV